MYLVENTQPIESTSSIQKSSIYRDIDTSLHLRCNHSLLETVTGSSSMGRQTSDRDTTAAHSSIALLQERFRQLERAKAMRQQRERARVFFQARQAELALALEVSGLFYHPELNLLQLESEQASLCCKSGMQNQHPDFLVVETPSLANSCFLKTSVDTSDNIDESDIDTSLHL